MWYIVDYCLPELSSIEQYCQEGYPIDINT